MCTNTTKFNFPSCHADPWIFISQRNGQNTILAIYIEDGLGASEGQTSFDEDLREWPAFKDLYQSLTCNRGTLHKIYKF